MWIIAKTKGRDWLLFAIPILLFFINNCLKYKVDLPVVGYIMANHLNDYLGGIAILAYINLVLALYKKRSLRLDNFWLTVIVILAIGVFWEWGSYYLRPNGTADPWDLLAYLLGGLTYFGLNKYLAKREYNKYNINE